MSEIANESSGLTRRTVLRTAAWSAPVITVMAAAPAYAVSGGDVGGPDGDYAFRVSPGEITVIGGGNGQIIYSWTFKNSGINPLVGVTFTFASTGVQRWIPAAGLVKVRSGGGRGRARRAAPSAVFAHNAAVAPGQTVSFSVTAVPLPKHRRTVTRMMLLAQRNSSAVATAHLANSKGIVFSITSVEGGRRRRRGRRFGS
mgnify:FL=1